MISAFRHSDDVWQTFPGLAAAALITEAVDDAADVARTVDEHLATARERAARIPESELPAIRAWRRTYARMGLKPTQFRCAAESLLRRIRTHGDLPRLHPLVDLCNAVSAAYAIPIAVLDLDRIEGDLIVRPAIGVETYLTFSGDLEHPAIGEIIYADEAGHAHSRRWVTRQSGRSAIRPSTRRALIVAEAMHDAADADVSGILGILSHEIGAAWGAAPLHRRLSRVDPTIELPAGVGDRSSPTRVDDGWVARETPSMQTPDESKEIDEVIDRLMKKFPTATRDEVVEAVSKEHEALTGHRVRDFVPVLVEKQAKKRLKPVHARQE